MFELIFGHPAFWLTALLAMSLTVGGLLLLAQFGRSRSKSLKEINEAIKKDRERTYGQAKRNYDEAKSELSKKFVVIDIIHDLGESDHQRDNTETRITMDDAFRAIRDIRKAGPNTPVLLVLHTFGGLSLPSMMIAEALSHRKGETIAYIYYVAASGGALLALSCEHIVMEAGARIGPVDTQFYGYSIESWRSLNQVKNPDLIGDRTWLTKMEIERYFKESVDEVKRVTREKYKRVDEHGKTAVDRLADGSVSHLKTYTGTEALDELKLDIQTPDKAPASLRKSISTVRDMVDNRLIMIGTHVSEGLRVRLEPSTSAPAEPVGAPSKPESSEHLVGTGKSEDLRHRYFSGG